MVASSAPEKNEDAVNEVKALGVEAKAYQCDVADFDKVGETVAKRALDKKIETVVFDRGGFVYHGRVQALAEGAREGGLKF